MMDLVSINQFLMLVSWFTMAGLIFILALIARFYQSLAGKETYYRYYIFPVMTLGVGTARYLSEGRWGGDWIGDGFMAISGGILLGLCYFLYRQMTNGRR